MKVRQQTLRTPLVCGEPGLKILIWAQRCRPVHG